MKVEDKKES